MTKVSDMIGDFAEPRGTAGYSVDYDIAISAAENIRATLKMDAEEHDISVAAFTLNQRLNEDQELFIAAWELLNPGERRAWREYVRLGKC